MLKRIGLSCLLFSHMALAEDNPVQRMHHFLAKASSLQAEFRQVLVNEKGEDGKQSFGEFY